MTETRQCPFCGHPRSRMMHKREYCEEADGTVAIRYAFYRKCNKCGATSPVVKTESTTCAWYGPYAEWTERYRDEADAAWDRRANDPDRDEIAQVANEIDELYDDGCIEWTYAGEMDWPERLRGACGASTR